MKLMATYLPAFIDPPPPPWMGFADPGLLQKWISFRAEMDQLEAWLNISFPDQDWTDAMQDQKDKSHTQLRPEAGVKFVIAGRKASLVISDREKVNVLADVAPDVGVLVPDLLVKPGGNFLDPVLTFIHGHLPLVLEIFGPTQDRRQEPLTPMSSVHPSSRMFISTPAERSADPVTLPRRRR